MSVNQDILNSIREANKFIMPYSIVCEVLAVTGDKCDCSPVNGDADLIDVRLQASTTTGILITPTVGSNVVVSLLSNGSAFVSMYSDIDSIQLNGSNYDGLVKVNDLVTKLNNLENDLNTLKTAFSSWVTVPNDGGAALKVATASWYAASLTPTVKANIENPLITHGNG